MATATQTSGKPDRGIGCDEGHSSCGCRLDSYYEIQIEVTKGSKEVTAQDLLPNHV